MQRIAKTIPAGALAPLLLLALSGLAACAEKPQGLPMETADAKRSCGERGFLSATLYGSIDRALNWSATDLECESMLRPDGEGVRFRFTGTAADEEVAIILAMPDLERGGSGSELPTVITLSVSGSGRFFSTPRSDACFADVDVHPRSPETDEIYEASGTLYCTAPLGEINGHAAVSIPRLEFRTRLPWSNRES